MEGATDSDDDGGGMTILKDSPVSASKSGGAGAGGGGGGGLGSVGGSRVRSWALEAESDDEDDGAVMGGIRDKKPTASRSRPGAPSASAAGGIKKPNIKWDDDEQSAKPKAIDKAGAAAAAAQLAAQMADDSDALEIEDDLEAEDLEDDMW